MLKRNLAIALAIIAVVLSITAVQKGRPVDHLADQVAQLTAKGPDVPTEFKDADHRGAGLVQGASVGAAPSTAYPRPDSWLKDRGYDYKFEASPNWSGRGSGDPIEAVVVHVTGDGTLDGMTSWFKQTVSQVSAQFGVGKDGKVRQYVEIGDVAWHAGIVNKPQLQQPLIKSWVDQGINPNRRTIGVEVVLKPGEKIGDYPSQVKAFDDLMTWLMWTLQLPADRFHVLGHNEIDSVNRAEDPVCCIWLDGTASMVASRLAPASPAVLSIEDRLLRIEQRLGIQ